MCSSLSISKLGSLSAARQPRLLPAGSVQGTRGFAFFVGPLGEGFARQLRRRWGPLHLLLRVRACRVGFLACVGQGGRELPHHAVPLRAQRDVVAGPPPLVRPRPGAGPPPSLGRDAAAAGAGRPLPPP